MNDHIVRRAAGSVLTALGLLAMSASLCAAEADPAEPAPAPASAPTQPAVAAPAAPAAPISPQIEDLVRLRESGVGAPVMKAFVENVVIPQKTSAAEVIYLHQHGVPPEVITAFVQKGGTAVARPNVAMPIPAVAAAPAPVLAPAPVVSAPPVNTVTYVSSPPVEVVYDYPYYSYPASSFYVGYWPTYWGRYGYGPRYWGYRPTWHAGYPAHGFRGAVGAPYRASYAPHSSVSYGVSVGVGLGHRGAVTFGARGRH